MAASPIRVVPTPVSLRRRALILSVRRIEANRHNAARSTGPRTAAGKAKVARNAIKHGFFAGPKQWTLRQQRDFVELLDGLRNDFKPHGVVEEGWVATIAESYLRMAAMLRYENIAALKYHERRECELNQRIKVADSAEAERLEARRDQLRAAGLWRPTIPGPREARAIARYSGSLERRIRHATTALDSLKGLRISRPSPAAKVQKQTHFEPSPRSRPAAAEVPHRAAFADPKMQNKPTSRVRPPSMKTQKQTH